MSGILLTLFFMVSLWVCFWPLMHPLPTGLCNPLGYWHCMIWPCQKKVTVLSRPENKNSNKISLLHIGMSLCGLCKGLFLFFKALHIHTLFSHTHALEFASLMWPSEPVGQVLSIVPLRLLLSSIPWC